MQYPRAGDDGCRDANPVLQEWMEKIGDTESRLNILVPVWGGSPSRSGGCFCGQCILANKGASVSSAMRNMQNVVQD